MKVEIVKKEDLCAFHENGDDSCFLVGHVHIVQVHCRQVRWVGGSAVIVSLVSFIYDALICQNVSKEVNIKIG